MELSNYQKWDFKRKCINCIYAYVNKQSSKAYIGQAADMKRRHKLHYNRRHSKYGIDAAIGKYGMEQFDIHIIEEDIPTIQMNEKERYYIALYGTLKNGYNRSIGGDSAIGCPCEEETRKKISASLMGNIPWNKGRKMTEEEKHKDRLGHLGKKSKKAKYVLKVSIDGEILERFRGSRDAAIKEGVHLKFGKYHPSKNCYYFLEDDFKGITKEAREEFRATKIMRLEEENNAALAQIEKLSEQISKNEKELERLKALPNI